MSDSLDSIYLGAAALSPVVLSPQLPWVSTKNPFKASCLVNLLIVSE